MNNQLQHLVFVIFPELVTMINPSTKTGLYLIKNYPDPDSIASLVLKRFSNIVKKVCRGRISQDRVEKLYNAAKKSVGITEGKESILLEIKHLVSNIENENRYIE